MNAQARRPTKLEAVVLGLLVERPDHGYGLKARLGPGLPRERRINDGVL
jgi:DNA-binding PadR family transcriptional regulator